MWVTALCIYSVCRCEYVLKHKTRILNCLRSLDRGMLCFFSVWLTRCVNAPEIPSAVSSSVPDCIPVSPLPNWPPPLPLSWFKVCILEDIDILIVIAQRKRKCSVRHTQAAMYTHQRHSRHVQNVCSRWMMCPIIFVSFCVSSCGRHCQPTCV